MDGAARIRQTGLRAPVSLGGARLPAATSTATPTANTAPSATPDPLVAAIASAPNSFNTPNPTFSGGLNDLITRFRGGVYTHDGRYEPNPGGTAFRSRTAADVATRYGIDTASVGVNANDPSAALGQLTQREIQRYDQLVVPAQQELINSLYDTSIVRGAKENADEGFEAARLRAERQRRRYGLRVTGAAGQQAIRDSEQQEALGYDASVNEARIEQKTRNDSIRRDLIDIGRGVATSAQTGLGAAADNQAAREALKEQQRAQRRVQNQQTATALATTVLTYVLAAY